MAALSYYDLVSGLRDLVDEYDSLIDEAKLWKGRAASGKTHGLGAFIDRANRMFSKAGRLLAYVSGLNSADSGDVLVKYAETYASYLMLISIPYTRDLLEEIRMRLIAAEKHDEAMVVEEAIRRANEILGSTNPRGSSSQ